MALGEGWINVVKLLRAHGGCLGIRKASKGVEDCEKLGGAVKRVLIPRSLNRHVLNP